MEGQLPGAKVPGVRSSRPRMLSASGPRGGSPDMRRPENPALKVPLEVAPAPRTPGLK